MPRLIWVFAGRTTTLLVLSWGGSNTLSHIYPLETVNYFLSTFNISAAQKHSVKSGMLGCSSLSKFTRHNTNSPINTTLLIFVIAVAEGINFNQPQVLSGTVNSYLSHTKVNSYSFWSTRTHFRSVRTQLVLIWSVRSHFGQFVLILQDKEIEWFSKWLPSR